MFGLNKPSPSVVVEVGPVDSPSQPTIIEPTLDSQSKSESTHINFIQYVQVTWKAALQYLMSSYLYVLISIGPCMILLMPYLYFGMIPYNIDFKGTIDDMSYQSRWRYATTVLGYGTALVCISFIVNRNVLIWDQSSTDPAARNRYCWISTILSILATFIGWGINILRFFGPDFTPLGDMVTVLSVFSNFWCVHMVTRHNEGSKRKHSVFAALIVLVDLIYGILVANFADFYQSEYFTWSSPFIFSITAIFSRQVAEVSTYPMSTASRVCSVSMVFNQIFVRGNHTIYLNNIGMMIGFEFFYSFVSILTKVTLYYRHAFVNKLTAGECKVVVKRTERGHHISTDLNVVDCVFECGSFVICSCLRQVVSPVHWGVWVFLVAFCLVIQFCNNVLSLLISGYIEGIPFHALVLQQRFDWGSLKRDTYYYVFSLSSTICFLLGMLMQLWNPSARTINI